MNEVKDENFKHNAYMALNCFTQDNLYGKLILLLYNEWLDTLYCQIHYASTIQ